jgi:cytochrome c oxidase accessory protein FixG
MQENTEFKGSERLDSLDSKGFHHSLHPADVRGVWRKYRHIVYSVLVIVFLALPWLRINGHQAILLDIPQRRFAILGLTFWAHDGPMIFFVLAILTLGLAFVTAIWGRVWCGWACPQTVFIDSIYRRIEKWIEGDYLIRRRLANAPLTYSAFFKKIMKWVSFALVSFIITHSFLAYFIGTEALGQMMTRPPQEHWTAFLIMAFITVVLTFKFGWFREQFCLIMCPYGRFQSVLLDESSLAVLYDEGRCEPRRGAVSKGEPTGDCVSCNKCVSACPTGIDIRNGLQMECIACSACIDACDEVMEKMNKPKGLIRYDSLSGLTGKVRTVWQPRTIVYLNIIFFALSGLAWQVFHHKEIDITLLRAVETPYQEITLANGQHEIINHFKLHIKNLSFNSAQITTQLPQEFLKAGYQMAMPQETVPIAAGTSDNAHFFVRFPKSETLKTGNKDIQILFTVDLNGAKTTELKGARLIGPH